MYLPFITLLLSVSVSNAQINALASVLEFADSGEFEKDHFSVLERPEESKQLINPPKLYLRLKSFSFFQSLDWIGVMRKRP